MIYLVYGQNTLFVRNFVKNQIVKGNSYVKEHNLEKVEDLNLLEQTLQTDIFGAAPLNIVNVSKADKSLVEKFINILKHYQQVQVVIVCYKDLQPLDFLVSAVKLLKGKVVGLSSLRHKEIFDYLDNLFNLDVKNFQKHLQKLLLYDNDPIYILTMLQYQLRNIAMAKFKATSKLKGWQLSSAQNQAKHFSNKQIVDLYELLYNYDVGLKSGTAVPDIVVPVISKRILSVKN